MPSADTGGQSLPPTLILEANGLSSPTDLAFHPTRTNELWVVNYSDGAAVTIYDPGLPAQRVLVRGDPARSHFMHRPTSIAMGVNDTWATCGDNLGDRNQLFMGPALFSADPDIFAKPFTDLGSHLDMLHQSPQCMGIAHQADNYYWVFNGYHSSVDLYDFARDHGPGMDDHSDGRVWRHVTGQMSRVAGIPSHLVFDAASGAVFIADTGASRVVRLNPAGSRPGPFLSPVGEPDVELQRVDNPTDFTTVVPQGTLERPSGLELSGGELYVGDNATGVIHVFTLAGTPVRRIETGLGAGALAGLTMGPDGLLYYLDLLGSRLFKVSPR